MPTETKSPSTNTQINSGWNNPAYAYESDNNRANTSTDNAEQEYGGYGFNIPEENIIESLKVKVEGYLTSPSTEQLTIRVYRATNGSWYSRVAPLTSSEQIVAVDFSNDADWTPNDINNIKVRMRYDYTGGGGCFHPESEFLSFDGTKLGKIKAKNCKIGDFLLGCECNPNLKRVIFKPAKILKIQKHSGKWNMIRFYIEIPPSYLKALSENPILKSLLNLKDEELNKPRLEDACVTANHPIITRNKGEIPAEKLEENDIVNVLLWEKGKFYTAPAYVIKIEKFLFEGEVHDIRTKPPKIFGSHLLGMIVKV